MNKAQSDFSIFSDEVYSHPAYISFVKEMKDRLYGSGPLYTAWHFFKAGWEAARIDAGILP